MGLSEGSWHPTYGRPVTCHDPVVKELARATLGAVVRRGLGWQPSKENGTCRGGSTVFARGCRDIASLWTQGNKNLFKFLVFIIIS